MSVTNASNRKAATRFLIIGAGMSGILMGIRLKEAGFENFTIIEKADDVGGTWRDNTYPGLHCDVQSHHYCYSFELNPEWTETFSSGPEIRSYLRATAEKYGIIPHIKFGVTGKCARWDGSAWNVKFDGAEQMKADVIISATGNLHVPAYPDIEGLDTFAGEAFHTARWDHEVGLEDKRIGLIGTGSTAVQLTCALSGNVAKLKLFQRTAQWVTEVPNPPITEEERARFRKDPSAMKDLYMDLQTQTAKQTGGAIMGGDHEARQALIENVESNLAKVKNSELRAKLTPNYSVGCKRLIMSPSFYEAVQDDSVEVITDQIDHIEEKGIVTQNGRLHELDVIVLATGFDPTAYIRPMELYGIEGRALSDVWRERPLAYNSIGVPDMPNFFMIGGPFSPVGNLSLFLVSEWQVEYIMHCIDHTIERGVAIAPSEIVTAEQVRIYREEAKSTIWATGGCHSWYQDDEGVPIIYPYSPEKFGEDATRPPVFDDFVTYKLNKEGS